MRLLAFSDVGTWEPYPLLVRRTAPDVIALVGDLTSDGHAHFWRTALGGIPGFQRDLRTLRKRLGVRVDRNGLVNCRRSTFGEYREGERQLEEQYRETPAFRRARKQQHVDKFYTFLKYAGARATVLVVKGDHDDDFDNDYDVARISGIPGCHEISDRTVTAEGLSVAAISWRTSYSLPLLRDAVKRLAAAPPDILLAHAPLKRRVWLLDCHARLIITGHCPPDEHATLGDSVFVSLCGGHAVINMGRRQLRPTVWKSGERVAEYAGGEHSFFGRQFRVMRALQHARAGLAPGQWVRPEQKAELRSRGVPLHAINEFLSPNARRRPLTRQ
jgi:hypothetical protein